MRVSLVRRDLPALLPFWLASVLAAASGCNQAVPKPEVVLYTSVSRQLVEPPLNDFHAGTQIEIVGRFVQESNNADALRKEFFDARSRPLGDVLWDSELLPTLLLDREGLFEPYQPAQARQFARHSSPEDTWHGLLARARVLLVNKEKLAEDARPKSIRDLVDGKWQGRVGLATPLRGASAAHAAALFVTWETAQAEAFYRQLKANARILESEEQVAAQVAAGELDFALTNSDAAMAEIDRSQPVVIVYPDQEKDGLGTLMVPNTVAVFKDCAHPQQARDLVEYLLTPATEDAFAAGPTALVPLSGSRHEHVRLPGIEGVHAMRVDFARMGAAWEKTSQFLHAEFGNPTK